MNNITEVSSSFVPNDAHYIGKPFEDHFKWQRDNTRMEYYYHNIITLQEIIDFGKATYEAAKADWKDDEPAEKIKTYYRRTMSKAGIINCILNGFSPEAYAWSLLV